MPPQPTAEQHSLALFDHLARAGRRATEDLLGPTGLRPRHLIALMLLADHGPVSQQALAEALSLDPSNVVGLLNELEQRSLLTRVRDPGDRRRHNVEISDTGRNELAAAQRLMASAEDEVLRALSPVERMTLHELLVRAAGGQLPPGACAAAAVEPPTSCADC